MPPPLVVMALCLPARECSLDECMQQDGNHSNVDERLLLGESAPATRQSLEPLRACTGRERALLPSFSCFLPFFPSPFCLGWFSLSIHWHWPKQTVLLPEEALFLMETDRMLLLHSDRSTRILSLQEAASLAHDAGVSSEEYLVYSHLRRAGFIARRYGLPWTDAGGNNGRRDGPSQKRRANFGVGERDPRPLRSAASDPRHRGWWSGELPSAERGEEGVERVRDLEPSFNVWAPNPGFSKKDPDRMLFRLVLCSDGPPSAREVRALREKAGTEVDLKFCSVANGIVMIFALRPWC